MCAGYPAGKRDAHHFINRGSAPATYLEIGNRIDGDNAFYPDDDLMWCDAGYRRVRRAQGRPPLHRMSAAGAGRAGSRGASSCRRFNEEEAVMSDFSAPQAPAADPASHRSR